MNTAHVMRTEATPEGVRLRLWVDDEEGRHLAVCELEIPESHMILWGRDIAIEQDHRDQQEFPFEE